MEKHKKNTGIDLKTKIEIFRGDADGEQNEREPLLSGEVFVEDDGVQNAGEENTCLHKNLIRRRIENVQVEKSEVVVDEVNTRRDSVIQTDSPTSFFEDTNREEFSSSKVHGCDGEGPLH